MRISVYIYVYIYIYIQVYIKDGCMSEVVSVRVRKDVKRVLEEAGVNIGEVIRKHLEELAWEITARKRLEELEKIVEERVRPSPPGWSVKSVREDRDENHRLFGHR